MGRTVYLTRHEWLFLMVNYGFHVGKYTSPMNAMGTEAPPRYVSLKYRSTIWGCFQKYCVHSRPLSDKNHPRDGDSKNIIIITVVSNNNHKTISNNASCKNNNNSI